MKMLRRDQKFSTAFFFALAAFQRIGPSGEPEKHITKVFGGEKLTCLFTATKNWKGGVNNLVRQSLLC